MEDAPRHGAEWLLTDEEAAFEKKPPMKAADAAEDEGRAVGLGEDEVRGVAHAVDQENGLGIGIQRKARPDAVGDVEPDLMDLIMFGSGEFL